MSEQQQTETTTVTESTHETREKRISSLFTDILTIISFAILFIIILWGLVHLVELISSSFSPSTPLATIQVSAPAHMTSGERATVSWNYAHSTAGSYAFLYECHNGLSFQTSAASDSHVPCGVAYTIGNTSSSLSLIPILAGTSSVSDTLSIVFIPSQGVSQMQGNATVTVDAAPAKAPIPAKTTAVKKPSYTSGSGYSGPADLTVSIISGSIDQNDNGAVTFNIANVGGSTSGSYTFSAQLPTAQTYPYVSPVQAPLAPGAHIISTLNFSDAKSGGGIFSVSIQSDDSNTADKYASTQISGPFYNNQNSYQGSYVPYPVYTH